MPRFKNQVLLLTGAGSGIGRATTLKLAAEGASLFVTDVVADALKETLELAADAASRRPLLPPTDCFEPHWLSVR